MDATEPQGANIGEWYYRLDDGKTHSDAEVGMAWVQQYHRMAYDGLSSLHLDEIPPFLTRSAFAGSQRYGAILWSGDIESTFDELATQVQVAQHVAMSGIYWWTTDIGGFRNGDPTSPVFRELIVRWFQFGGESAAVKLPGRKLASAIVSHASVACCSACCLSVCLSVCMSVCLSDADCAVLGCSVLPHLPAARQSQWPSGQDALWLEWLQRGLDVWRHWYVKRVWVGFTLCSDGKSSFAKAGSGQSHK